MIQLAICYSQPGQRPQYVAMVEDEELIRKAAHLAIEQAEMRAAAITPVDPVAGRLHAVEVARLRAALSILVPTLIWTHKPPDRTQ